MFLAKQPEALGTQSLDFVNGLVEQLARAGAQDGSVREQQLNFMLSVIKGIEPKDQIEAMVAAQMAAVHIASMTAAGRLAIADYLPHQDSAERAFNKLTRTFAMLVETLKRHRTGGEQKVTVQHVSVSEGGQAIVGNVTQAARSPATQSPTASPLALTHDQTAAMPIIKESVPAAAAVSVARERNRK